MNIGILFCSYHRTRLLVSLGFYQLCSGKALMWYHFVLAFKQWSMAPTHQWVIGPNMTSMWHFLWKLSEDHVSFMSYKRKKDIPPLQRSKNRRKSPKSWSWQTDPASLNVTQTFMHSLGWRPVENHCQMFMWAKYWWWMELLLRKFVDLTYIEIVS